MRLKSLTRTATAANLDGVHELPWRALQENVTSLLPTQATGLATRLQRQTRGICVQSTLAKWYCRRFVRLLQQHVRAACLTSGSGRRGRSATESAATLQLLASAAHE